MRDKRVFFLLLFAALLAARLCHLGILWAEESYPLAAAAQMDHGRHLYRELWFDKPPLVPVIYQLWGVDPGWRLRLADALYGLLVCALIWRFARDLWGEREADIAAALLAFFLIFDIPSAVTPIASDLMMLAPHVAAVWLAFRGRTFWSGVLAGIAFWINPKGLLVAVVCALWNPAGAMQIAAGWLAAGAVAAAWLLLTGAAADYYQQVWQWGRIYASQTFVADPVRNAVERLAHWMGFHAALVVAAVYALVRGRDRRIQWGVWLFLALLGAAAGWRFFPRYFFQLLPVAVLLAARGFATLPLRYARAAALLLLIPLIRFGPRYVLLATGHSATWTDTAMDRDSRAAAALVLAQAQTGDTLFIWGYRPDLYVYTHLPAAIRFFDSQPLTGVPADRHLTQIQSVVPEMAAAHRAELVRTRPAFVLDGLGAYNPALAITQYPDLREWLADYREVARSPMTVIYRRR